MIMLLIIAGISFTWYFLHEEREKNEKKYKGKDEFDVLLETTEVPEEDKDVYLDKNKTYVTKDEYTHEIPTISEEAITVAKKKKVKKSHKTNKK